MAMDNYASLVFASCLFMMNNIFEKNRETQEEKNKMICFRKKNKPFLAANAMQL